MTSLPPPPGEIVGTILNYKYEIQKRLSQGGMGVVYKARHLMLDTPVALKVLLKPESEEAQRRFLSEARLASKIRHPNTVYIADFGVFEDGRAFLEMEYLDGRTLRAEISKGSLGVLRSGQIAIQIARGLQAVHDKGIVHRDLKPDNVFLLEQDGNTDFVKIVDFGIAKAAHLDSASGAPPTLSRTAVEAAPQSELQRSAQHTELGMVMGTPGFMAPEQVQGLRATFAADQYALGCLLYEMIAGQPVFVGPGSQRLLIEHLSDNPPPLRQRCPLAKVSKGLDAIVLRLLEKDPAARFGSMREVEHALQAEIDRLLIGSGQRPARAYALAGGRKVAVFGSLWPLWLVIAVPMVFLLIAVGYGGYRWLAQRGSAEATLSRQSAELRELRNRAIAILQKDARGNDADLRDTALTALGQTGDVELREDLLVALASPEPSTRTQAAAALGSLGDRRAVLRLAAVVEGIGSPSAVPGGHELLQVRVAAAAALRLLGDPRGVRFLEETLSSKDQEAQLRAALLFCAQGPPDVQRILTAYLQRTGLPAETVLSLLGCAARAGNAAALARLHTQVGQVGPPELRLASAVKLAQQGDGEGLKYLREVLQQRDRDYILAARELALLEEPEGLPPLRPVAENPSAASLARQLACDGLGALGELADARRLVALLRVTGDPPLRQAAARAIVRIAGRDPAQLSLQSLSWAKVALADSDALYRQSAASILGDNRDAGAVSLLAGLLKDPDVGVRRSVVAAIGRHANERAVLLLRDGLQDADTGVRIDAMRALLRLGSSLNAPALAQAAELVRKALTALLVLGSEQTTAVERLLATSILSRLGDREQLKRLRQWLTAKEPELRRLAIEQLPLSADELAALLLDKASEVRAVAARKLGELGDRRAAAGLREVFERGGPAAVWAYALLSHLGIPVQPDPIVALLADSIPERRAEAIAALSQRPAEQVLPLLTLAARDPAVQVRVTVAEVAAELAEKPGGEKAGAILRRLANDADPRVRARAAALLAKSLHSPAPDSGAQTSGENPTAPSRQVAETPPPAEQPDRRATAPPDAPTKDSRLDGAQPHEPLSNPKRREEASTAQLEQLVHGGLDSFERKDYKQAQRQLAKALALCSRDHRRGGPCTEFSFEILYRFGQIHEQQKAWPEAMSEYQQVTALAPLLRGHADIKADVQQAVQRLAPRLGQVVVPKRTKHRCQEDTIWMSPGSHSIRVDSKFEQIEVKAREVVRVGSCH